MSLRGVHILFIVVATATMFGFAVWCVLHYLDYHASGDLVMGGGSLLTGALLIWYGNRFFRKLRSLKMMRPL